MEIFRKRRFLKKELIKVLSFYWSCTSGFNLFRDQFDTSTDYQRVFYSYFNISIQNHNLNCHMQYQTCECGERIPANELPTKLLTHWNHQSSCLYSYIGCVSKINFKIVYQSCKIEVINININLSFAFCKAYSKQNISGEIQHNYTQTSLYNYFL